MARANERVAFSHAPGRRQHQRKREIGGSVIQHSRRIAHQHAVRRRRCDIDIVEAHAHVRDHPDALQPGDHGARKRVGKLAHDRLFAARPCDQFLGSESLLSVGIVHLGVLLQEADGFRKNMFGNQNCRAHW